MIFGNPVAGTIQSYADYLANRWDGRGFIVTAPFASIDASHPTPHTGIDMGQGRGGGAVLAAADGSIGLLRGVDGVVELDHPDGYRTVYAHLRLPFERQTGARVMRGQLIGQVGATGTQLAHLHFEVKRGGVHLDPWPFLNATMEGDMANGVKLVGKPIGTFRFVGNHQLISPLDSTRRYPRPDGETFNVIAAVDLKDADGKPIDVTGNQPPLNNWDQLYLVDAPAFGIAAYALRADGVFTAAGGNMAAAYNEGLAAAQAAVEALPER